MKSLSNSVFRKDSSRGVSIASCLAAGCIIALSLSSSIASAASSTATVASKVTNAVTLRKSRTTLPTPIYDEEIRGPAIFDNAGVSRVFTIPQYAIVLVNASYTAHYPNRGFSRQILGNLAVKLNNSVCAWANDGNQSFEDTMAGSASCMTVATGPVTVTANADAHTCCNHVESPDSIDGVVHIIVLPIAAPFKTSK